MNLTELTRSPQTRLALLAALPGALLLAGMFLTRPGPRQATAAVAEIPVVALDRNAGLIRLPAAALADPPTPLAPQASLRGPAGPFRSLGVITHAPVIDVAPESGEITIPRCTAIISGRHPMAIVEGRVYAAGETLPGDWLLLSIDAVAREVLLQDRDGAVYRKRLDAPRLKD